MLKSDETALLVIDVQNDFCSPGGVMEKIGKDLTPIEETMPKLLQCVNYFQENELNVIFIQTKHGDLTDSDVWKTRGKYSDRNCVSEWGRQFYKISPRESDAIIEKNRYSSFVGTNLDLVLRAKGIKNLILTGFTTNVCVEGTARDAFMFGYNVITLSDCVASYNEHEHISGLFNLRNYFGTVMKLEEMIQKIG